MTRKLISTLLCLVLAVALPLAALADTQHVLTLVPGDGMTALPAIADFCEALSFTLNRSEKSGGLTLAVDGEDIATVALSADSTGLYVQSTLLGDDVYYLTWDDGFAYAPNLITELAEKKGVKLNEAMVNMIRGILAVNKARIVAALGAMSYAGASTVTGGLDAVLNNRETFMKAVRQVFPDDTGIADVYKRVFDKMTLEEGEFADPERDTATRHLTMVMTSEDIGPICDTQYMRSAIEMLLKVRNPELEGEELAEAAVRTTEQVRSIYEESGLQMIMNVYTSEEDTTLVGMDMGMEMTLPAGEEKVRVSCNLNYDRLTGNNGVDHRADMSILAGGETIGLMGLQLTQGREGVSDGYLAALVNRQQVTYVYHAENQGNERVRTLNLYRRGNAAAIIAPAASDRPIFGFRLVSGPAEDDVLEDIDHATGETAINVMKLSAEEMQSLLTDLRAHAIQAGFTALGSLSDSVTKLLMSLVAMFHITIQVR